MRGVAGWVLAAIGLPLLTSMAVPLEGNTAAAAAVPAVTEPAPPPEPPPPPPPPVTARDLLADGVVIVISKPSQQMYVLRDGQLWRSSPVSTGKRGKATPSGTFAILQKKVKHRSNLYSNAPMPYMQRLTWSGIAIHAGHLPGYPASHGCIRLPHAFAKELYGLTKFGSTAVIVTDEPIDSGEGAFRLAGLDEVPVPIDPIHRPDHAPRLAQAAAPPLPPLATASPQPPKASRTIRTRGSGQTIQLAAALSPREAEAHWSRLVRIRPELAQMHQTIVPAVVNSRQYYRLRVSAPDAHRLCGDLKRAGIDCFAVS